MFDMLETLLGRKMFVDPTKSKLAWASFWGLGVSFLSNGEKRAALNPPPEVC